MHQASIQFILTVIYYKYVCRYIIVYCYMALSSIRFYLTKYLFLLIYHSRTGCANATVVNFYKKIAQNLNCK